MEELDIDFTDPESAIAKLKVRDSRIPEWNVLNKDYDVKNHSVMDAVLRPDEVKDGKLTKPARITVSLEKLAVKRMTEFMFAIPVKRIYNGVDNNKTRQEIVKAIEKIFAKNRIDAINIRRSRSLFASCEVATIWYAVEKNNKKYGFESKYELKCKSYSPMDGYKIYPYINEKDDLLAISFEYTKHVNDKEITYFETLYNGKHYCWKNGTTGYEEITNESLNLKKLPIIYGYRLSPIYEDLSEIRSEIEWTLSRNGDVIGYNSSPILEVAGQIEGSPADKDKSSRVVRVELGGSVKYVSWDQAIEAIKFHIEMLLRLFFMQLQLPDLSFENIKGLGAMSGESRKTLLTDAHLKVGDEKDIFIEFFDRECNVVKEFLKIMNPNWANDIDEIDIENVITPFIQNDESTLVDMLIKGTGGEAIIPVVEAIKQLGWTENASEWLEQLLKEAKERNSVSAVKDVFQTAV